MSLGHEVESTVLPETEKVLRIDMGETSRGTAASQSIFEAGSGTAAGVSGRLAPACTALSSSGMAADTSLPLNLEPGRHLEQPLALTLRFRMPYADRAFKPHQRPGEPLYIVGR